jgi:hypothetical protein
MSNDPLALSILSVGPPRETDYDAVYAAVTATERGRWFLLQYAKHNRNADTALIMAAIARIEATIRGDAPPQASAISSADLTAMAAAIERIRGAVAAAGLPMSGIGSAAERIADVSFSLRERSADAALCDTLDATAREISEACASRADHARGVTELLRDLASRVHALLNLSPADLVSCETSSSDSSQISIDVADAAVPPQAYGDDTDLPASAPTIDGARWHIESPDFVFAPADRVTDKIEAEPVSESEHFHALLPATQLQSVPPDPADLFEASVTEEADAPVPGPVSAVATLGAGDPLAAMRGLSDDEVTALFG